MPGVPGAGLVVDHPVDESLPPAHLGGIAVGVVHLLDVAEAAGGHAQAAVGVGGDVGVGFVNVAVDAASPVSVMQFSWANVRRAEPVDEFRAAFREFEEFANDVWNPSDLAAFELNLGSLDEIGAMLAEDSVVVVPCDLPDAVIMIA